MLVVGFLTDYALNKLNDLVFRATAATPPTLYAGLSTATANRALPPVELAATGGYARVAVGAANFTVSTAGVTSNSAPITFPTPTLDWLAVRSLVLYDAATGGNAWAIIALTAADPAYLTRLVGQQLIIPAGAIQFGRS